MELKLDGRGRVVQGTMDDLANPQVLACAVRDAIFATATAETDIRIARFVEAFSYQYPPSDEIASSQALLYGLGVLEDVLALYLLGRNAAVYVELYAWLERTALISVPFALTRDAKRAAALQPLIDRKTLVELAECLKQISVLDDDDLGFIRELKRIRDGLAHKNAELISRHIFSGKPIKYAAISAAIDERDSAVAIVRTLFLIVRISFLSRHPQESE